MTMHNFGWLNPSLTLKNKQRVTRDASISVVYVCGYIRPFAHSILMDWDSSTRYATVEGHVKVNTYLKSQNTGFISYINQIEI